MVDTAQFHLFTCSKPTPMETSGKHNFDKNGTTGVISTVLITKMPFKACSTSGMSYTFVEGTLHQQGHETNRNACGGDQYLVHSPP